ncbi:hypothetical protein ES702_03976 [subsurface metagenome]
MPRNDREGTHLPFCLVLVYPLRSISLLIGQKMNLKLHRKDRSKNHQLQISRMAHAFQKTPAYFEPNTLGKLNVNTNAN